MERAGRAADQGQRATQEQPPGYASPHCDAGAEAHANARAAAHADADAYPHATAQPHARAAAHANASAQAPARASPPGPPGSLGTPPRQRRRAARRPRHTSHVSAGPRARRSGPPRHPATRHRAAILARCPGTHPLHRLATCRKTLAISSRNLPIGLPGTTLHLSTVTSKNANIPRRALHFAIQPWLLCDRL